MITAKEAAEAMQVLALATTQDQLRIQTERAQLFHDRLRMAQDHAANLVRAKAEQDRMNAENAAYIKREWDKNHPPEPERIMPWQLSRDDIAELRLWWDWKQLDGEVKREMLPPPCASEMTQAFMDTNPAWKFRKDGTLVASLTDDAFLSATENGSNIASLVWAVSCSIALLFAILVIVEVLTHV